MDSLLANYIINATLLRFKMPSLEQHNGSSDPNKHIQNYKTIMRLHRVTKPLMSMVFPTILRKTAKDWYNRYPRGPYHPSKTLLMLSAISSRSVRRRRKVWPNYYQLAKAKGIYAP